MSEMEASVTIHRPLAEVFDFFFKADENAPLTDPEAGFVTKTPEGPTRPGTTFRFQSGADGKIRETTTRYTTAREQADGSAQRLHCGSGSDGARFQARI
jgi:hypothetical protein